MCSISKGQQYSPESQISEIIIGTINTNSSITFNLQAVSPVWDTDNVALGNEVLLLEKGYKSKGSQKNIFDGSNLSSGMYFYELKSSKFHDVKKKLLLK